MFKIKYWNNYINMVAQSPNDEYRNTINALVDAQWHNTTLLRHIQEEHPFGSLKFCNIEAWVQTVTTFTNNIIKDANDFRELLFKVNPHHNLRGQYYIWDDNYWIIYDTTDDSSVHSTALLRRCNNVIKWLDVDSGIIYEYPCVLEYDISATNPRVDKDINVANSSITLVLQGNENTRKLKRNQRFIINGIPYKFVAYNNYMQQPTLNDDVTLYFIDLDFDIEKPTDDLINNIADMKQYQYSVNIADVPSQQIRGFEAQAKGYVLLNGEITSKPIVWTGNQNVEVSADGTYKLIGNIGSIAQITAHFGSFSQTVNIEIVGILDSHIDIVITPNITELNEGETVEFTAIAYNNGVAQTDTIDYYIDGAPSECYQLIQTDNNFVLTNLQQSKNLLHIIFSLGDVSKEMFIKLKALY